MSSQGSPIITFRVPPEFAGVLEGVDAVVARSVETRKGKPLTRTAFILAAIREKLDHIKRSNKPKRKAGLE